MQSILVQGDDPHDEKTAKDRYSGLTKMKYTEAFIYEVLRLHPSVPIDIKYAVDRDVLPDGTIVPAGSMVCYSPYVFHYEYIHLQYKLSLAMNMITNLI